MIKIKYFARLSEHLKLREEDFELGNIDTVDALIQSLKGRGTLWSNEFSGEDKIMIALNHEMCSRDASLESGDEVGFFPPVTGG